MKLYLVKADSYYCREYDSFVVWANSEADAKRLVLDKLDDDGYEEPSNFAKGCTVTEIAPPKEGCIVLGSYNAG